MGTKIPEISRRDRAKRSPSFRPSRRLIVRRDAIRNGYGSCSNEDMRIIKLTGRECSILRGIGFTESMLGTEIQDFTHMEADDVAEVLNGLMAAGYVESIPYCEQIELAEMPVMAFEVNAAYAHDLKNAVSQR
jgi:hypothetical protein